MSNILSIIAVILIILWLIGYLGFNGFGMGDLIHYLLIIAFMALILRFSRG